MLPFIEILFRVYSYLDFSDIKKPDHSVRLFKFKKTFDQDGKKILFPLI